MITLASDQAEEVKLLFGWPMFRNTTGEVFYNMEC